jgi:hypothetical protein
MPDPRIALYVGDELYPVSGSDPSKTVEILQRSPLTSPILSLVNQSGDQPDQLVYNEATNPIFDTTGAYIGSDQWAGIVASLRGGGDVREVYLSFSTNGTAYMNDLLSSNKSAAQKILSQVKNELGFDGIDLDYEGGDYSPGSPIYPVAAAAVEAGLALTAAPFSDRDQWGDWVLHVQGLGGTVSWLNLQCYSGGKSNNPGDWLGLGAPIVAGTCSNCCCPQTTCSPADVESALTLWRTGKGSVSSLCWNGSPNTQAQAIGGGVIWAYSSIAGAQFFDYMNAMKTGLGL